MATELNFLAGGNGHDGEDGLQPLGVDCVLCRSAVCDVCSSVLSKGRGRRRIICLQASVGQVKAAGLLVQESTADVMSGLQL